MQSLINNTNLLFTSQIPKSILNMIRNNVLYVLVKFANVKNGIRRLYEEVSNLLTENQFEELNRHATSEPHDALIIDTHPKTEGINDLKRISTYRA